jgi:hypothetical protein
MPPRLLFATCGSALFAALFLIGEPVGIGVALVGLAVIGIAVAATRPREPWRIACWVAAAALALVPAIRAAEWVVLLSLLAAVPLASLAASGARTWREVAAGALAWIARFVPALTRISRSTARHAPSVRLGAGARGAALAAVLLAIFVPLFVAADAAFAEIVDGALTFDLTVDHAGDRLAAFLLVAGLTGALVLVAERRAPRPQRALPNLGGTEWLIALVALDVLFAAFVTLQLATLFGGDEYVLRTAGLTYAEYAREGFGQLIAAAALTLAVIALARKDTPALKLLLGLLCALTLVVLASALKRLGLYEEAYGFTRLRLMAHGAILWLAALFALILAAGALKRGALLPRATVALSALAALTFALSNPDGWIASHNLARAGEVDRAYLHDLSADAEPALAGTGLAAHPPADSALSWNYGRARARR